MYLLILEAVMTTSKVPLTPLTSSAPLTESTSSASLTPSTSSAPLTPSTSSVYLTESTSSVPLTLSTYGEHSTQLIGTNMTTETETVTGNVLNLYYCQI